MSRSFTERAASLAKRANSRIVLAFDPEFNPYKLKLFEERSKRRREIQVQVRGLLSELEGMIAGIKLGLPAMLALGPDELEKLVDNFKAKYFFICDLKLADIGYVNRLVAEQIFELGFDALIIHAFIGTKQGVDEVVELAGEMGRGVLAVCAMTHKGANEHLNKYFGKLTALAISAGVDGFILPATFPRLITKTRKKYPRMLIFSPGVGAQGAPFGSAIKAGADFEIIGRAIYTAPAPTQKVRESKEAMGR